MHPFTKILKTIAFAILLASGATAHADIYGYIDEQGGAHFSTDKLDARYQLFIRDNQSFDSASVAPTPATPTPSIIGTPLFNYLSRHPNLKKYETMVDAAAQEFGLEAALLKAIMAAESGFNPTAVSIKGAVGLMQIMPATAERYGLRADTKKTIEQKLTDPLTNIRLSARYLRDLHKLFPAQPQLVIASYNAGEGAVQRYKNSVPPYPETRNYVQLVTRFSQAFQSPATRLADATNHDVALPAKRIQMIIPGRANLPRAPFSTLE